MIEWVGDGGMGGRVGEWGWMIGWGMGGGIVDGGMGGGG